MLNTFTIYYWFSLYRGLDDYLGGALATCPYRRAAPGCSFKFSVSFSRVTWNVSVLNHCGETRVEKINDQLWDYSVINGIFLNFLPSVTGNEITGWYVLIFLHTLLVRELDLHALRTRGVEVCQDRCGSLVRTGSRINHWGIFVPSIAFISRMNPELFLKLCSMYMSEKRKHHSNS